MAERRPTRARARRPGALAALVALALALGAGGGGAAAQSFDDPFAAFGGFNAAARSGGIQISYDVQGVLPLPPPLIEVTVPTSRASSATGPSTLAFGSVAYPGDLVGNLPSLAEQSAPGTGALVPPYPLAALAEFPKGPPTTRQDIGTASAAVHATADGSSVVTSMAGSDVPGAVAYGAVTTASRTGIEGGSVVSRARAHVASASLLLGLVELHDVVADVVAATDGTTARAEGTTTIGSASVLGLPASIGPDGLTLAPNPAVDLLGPITAPIADLLAAAGIRISVAPLQPVHDGPSASIEGAGALLELTVDGSSGALAQLLALLPSDQLPGEALPGVPVNTSPQALVNLLKETHVTRVALAPVRAAVDATQAFPLGPDDGPAVQVPSGGGQLAAAPAGAGFTTPLPVLPARSGSARPGPGGPVEGRAVGALVVVLAALSLPLWAVASRRLMDATLCDTAPRCAGDPDRSITGGPTRGARRPGPG